MLKEIIHPKTQEYLLHIPKEYLNTEIEVLLIPLKEMHSISNNRVIERINKTPEVLSSQKMSLKALLASWSPLNEEFQEIEDYPPIKEDIF
jgi:hypothetical protein